MDELQPKIAASEAGDAERRQSLQSLEYTFPYHWIPERRGTAWVPARSMEWAHEYFRILFRVSDLAQEMKPVRVLDFGCGDGRLSHELLTTTNATLVGIDRQDEAIQFARAFNLPQAARGTFVCGELAGLSEGDFDVVIAMEVLEHIPLDEYPAVIEQLWERMKPRGRFIVSVPTTNRPVQEKHERHFTAESLAASLKPRFVVRSVEYVHSVRRLTAGISRLAANRYFVLLSRRLNAPLTRIYNRIERHTRAEDGAHLIAVFDRRDAECS